MQTKYILVSILFLFLNSCEFENNQDSELYNLIPSGFDYIIETDDISNFISAYTSNPITKNYTENERTNFRDFLKAIEILFPEGEAIIAIDEENHENPDYLVLLNNNIKEIKSDSLQNFAIETEVREKDTLIVYTIDSTEIYSKRKGRLSFISNKRKTALDFNFKHQESISKSIKGKLKLEGNYVSVLNDGMGNPFPLILKPQNLGDGLSITNALDVNFLVEDDILKFNGITTLYDTETNLLDIFENTIPQENRFSLITPTSTDAVYSFTFDDADQFYNNLHSRFIKESLIVPNKIENAIEFAKVSKGNLTALVAYSLNIESTVENIGETTFVENYKDYEIHEIEMYSNHEKFFNSFYVDSYQYFSVIENFVLLSNTTGYLKEFISAHINQTTLANSESYKSMMGDLSDESSIFIFYNPQKFNETLQNKYKTDTAFNNKWNASYLAQFIVEKNYAHVNILIGNKKSSDRYKELSENLSFKLDNAIIGNPQFVENHLGKNMDIAIQDVNNILYLVNNEGEILFKRQLDGRILGEINTLDTFKNGRKQLAFTTESSIYIIARNGKDVGNFHMKLRDKITQPLSLFDYDNKRNYRLLVTQGNELLMLDKNGKRVNGFKYKKESEDILTQPKHFRFGGKDYIVYAQGNSLRVLSRTGKIRISINDNFDFSENEIYPYQDKFTFVEASGNLVQVDGRSRVSRNPFYQPVNPKIASTSKTLVSLDENRLKIRANTINLEFGQYTDPKVFYLNNKIYVSTTDLQTNKVYLFDSQAEPISGFPVYGSSSIDIGNFDRDNSLEVLTKDGETGILVYELN